MRYRKILLFAREQRKNQTEAEGFFWDKVRRKQIFGMKITRQFIIKHAGLNNDYSYFIADFYCHQKKLIIEIDGGIHEKQLQYDEIRTNILKELKFSVIRFTNSEVLNNWPKVEAQLITILS